jgi:hypothetical protein
MLEGIFGWGDTANFKKNCIMSFITAFGPYCRCSGDQLTSLPINLFGASDLPLVIAEAALSMFFLPKQTEKDLVEMLHGLGSLSFTQHWNTVTGQLHSEQIPAGLAS